ncbi:hypothetical protein ACQVTU_10735 [Bacillus cereus]|uniref:hypothetical protein n=1 Tax=Bacillus cereus TaxID=1396 RepID=UPI003D648524
MIVETRKTIVDTEYWDTAEKRSLFVPTGEAGTELILHNKAIKELCEYADELGIEIPDDVKKKKDIIDLLS